MGKHTTIFDRWHMSEWLSQEFSFHGTAQTQPVIDLQLVWPLTIEKPSTFQNLQFSSQLAKMQLSNVTKFGKKRIHLLFALSWNFMDVKYFMFFLPFL